MMLIMICFMKASVGTKLIKFHASVE